MKGAHKMNLNALRSMSYGMYIVSSGKDGLYNGQIANTVFQITSDPTVIGVSINKQNLTHEFIEKSKGFSLSILNTDADFKFIGNFGFKSGRDIDKFQNTNIKYTSLDMPVVMDNTCAWIECKVINSVDCGTHTLFFGELTDCDVLNESEPMTYSYYHKVVKGKSPKTAPTFINN